MTSNHRDKVLLAFINQEAQATVSIWMEEHAPKQANVPVDGSQIFLALFLTGFDEGVAFALAHPSAAISLSKHIANGAQLDDEDIQRRDETFTPLVSAFGQALN